MAIGTAYVQGEDVAARGRVLLFSFSINENPQNLVLDEHCEFFDENSADISIATMFIW